MDVTRLPTYLATHQATRIFAHPTVARAGRVGSLTPAAEGEEEGARASPNSIKLQSVKRCF